ncbi:MAG: discoidin domain-containing protein [Clostridia bacterium]|nr:discoidin domain-containing protein [Clostridia bacterium]
MNYWPVFSTNLAELFDCYIDYFNAYLPKAEALAQSHILSQHSGNADLPGGSGWSIGTGANPYSMYLPNGVGTDGYGTGALMAKSFYEYYEFTQDQTKLEEELYPAVLGAALFMTKVLEPYGDDLLEDPSSSPEQSYTSVGTAWDQQNAYEMHKDAIELAKVLGKENDEEVKLLEERIDRLDPVVVGASGQVKEFREENYYGEIGEYNHRHISQLVGLYPGTIINETTPAWFDAAAVTMTERGDKSTGWAMAHRLNLWARTKRGERAYALYQQLLKTGTNNNLWDTHPPFQIDGNLGGTSGVAEMLLQSHEGYIEPLPAIPEAWSSGNYSGLVARGNFEVAAKWSGGQMETIRITSKAGETCRVKYYNIGQATVTASDGSQVSVTKENGDLIRFATKEGVSYTISEIPSYTAVQAPSDLKVSLDQTDFKQASLTWTASEDAASYTVYRAEESAPDYTVVAENVTGTSYTYDIPEASVGKQATYKVTATASNGRESQGTAAIAEAVTVAAPEKVTGQFVTDSTLQVTASAVENADGYTLYEKRNGKWETCQKSTYPVMVLQNADKSITYGVSARISQFESDITEMTLGGGSATVEENVFLNQTITGTKSVISSYPYENALDGSMSTRYAVGDSADPNSVTITLDGTYLLDTLRIYEFKPDEGGTRSGNTKIELQIDGTWETVIENQSLDVITSNGQYTSFALGNRAATAARITFQNTSGNAKSATIWEIQCSGMQLVVPETEENVLLNKPITGSASTISNMGYDLMVDGYIARSNTDRMAIGDGNPCNGVFNVTIDLEGTYQLYDLKLYEWGGSTRSQETTIAVSKDGGSTYQVITDPVSLTPSYDGSKYNTFSLGGAEADHVRINFKNTITDSSNENYHKSATIYEVQCSGAKVDLAAENNVLSGKIATSSVGNILGGYGLDCLTDGKLDTRFAIGDGAASQGTYSLTFDLGEEQYLDELKIYEFQPSGTEGVGTRSQETTVEVYRDDEWVTVIDKQSLQDVSANGDSTVFSLGYARGSQLRITFKNTASTQYHASIWEITCSSAKAAGGSDKSALCQALLLASGVDTGKLSEEQLTEWNTVLTQAEDVLNNEKATQSQVDQAAGALRELAEGYNAVMPEAPTASNVRITGTAEEYETLTLSYDYNDANQDEEQGSKYLWQVSGDGEIWTDIAGANEKTYVAANDYVGKYLRALVKPCSDAEPSIGVYTPSEAVGPIAISPDFESFTYTDLLLEHTQTTYTAGSSGQIHVTGTADRGGRYDITGHEKLTYQSSDPMVAEAEDGTGILTLGKEGTAVVTAIFHNDDGTTASASVVIIVYNGSRVFEGFETKTFDPAVDTHIAKVTDPVNTGSFALKISKYPSGSTSTQGKWNRYDIYRSTPYTASMILQGWFYDNGTSESADAYIYFQAHDKDEDGNQLPCTGQYNVGLQTGISNKYYSVTSGAGNRTYEKTGTNYIGAGNVRRALDGQNGFDAVPRSKGWHQVVYVSTGDSKDRFTDQGIVSIYVDGVLAFTEQYVNPTMNVAAGVAAYSLPQFSYYDDLMICQHISKKPVTVTYSQGGTVLIGGQTVASGAKADYDVANGLSLTVQPESGYGVDSVTANGQQMIPDENGIVTLSNITEETNVAVTFTQLTETPPQISSQSEYNWFKTEENKPVIFAYGKLNQYYQPGFEAQYGMKIWRQADPAQALLLPACDAATQQPAKAAPGQAFVIKMYGEAISRDETYVVQPYVGDTFGEEVTMTFEE